MPTPQERFLIDRMLFPSQMGLDIGAYPAWFQAAHESHTGGESASDDRLMLDDDNDGTKTQKVKNSGTSMTENEPSHKEKHKRELVIPETQPDLIAEAIFNGTFLRWEGSTAIVVSSRTVGQKLRDGWNVTNEAAHSFTGEAMAGLLPAYLYYLMITARSSGFGDPRELTGYTLSLLLLAVLIMSAPAILGAAAGIDLGRESEKKNKTQTRALAVLQARTASAQGQTADEERRAWQGLEEAQQLPVSESMMRAVMKMVSYGSGAAMIVCLFLFANAVEGGIESWHQLDQSLFPFMIAIMAYITSKTWVRAIDRGRTRRIRAHFTGQRLRHEELTEEQKLRKAAERVSFDTDGEVVGYGDEWQWEGEVSDFLADNDDHLDERRQRLIGGG